MNRANSYLYKEHGALSLVREAELRSHRDWKGNVYRLY